MTLKVCIALHDVAPATWPQCEQLLKLIDDLGRPALTLLVVPDYHGHGRLAENSGVVRAIDRRVDRGAEVALHGYFHRDDAPAPRNSRDWLQRRVLTAREGEFATLSTIEAGRRIRRGWSELIDLGWPARGFVAPAWLNSSGTWRALSDSPLRYAATRRSLILLDGMREIAAPALSASSRSRWRRGASRVWSRWFRAATGSMPILRIALHPRDAEHATLMDDWRHLLALLLAEREALTKAQVLGLP
ncbi:MAG: polysaccharide deacetylase family protein [Rhodanobacteraceae bacterium]